MTDDQLYYRGDDGNFYPNKRKPDPCDRHDEVIAVLKDHGSRIATLESLTVAHNERMVTIFNRLEKIDSGIEALNKRISSGVVTALVMLAGFFIWYVQSGGI